MKKILQKKKMVCFAFGFLSIFFLTSNLFAEQIYNFKAPVYQIKKTADGFHRILLDGYYSYAVPGYPDLPSKILRFVVPPDVVARSIKVEYSVKRTEALGEFIIRECPSMATRHGDQIILGRKADIYSNDSYYPENTVEYLGFSQMRKWKFVTLKYTPFQYNPVTKDLKYVPEVNVTITYDRMGRASVSDAELVDEVMDNRAEKLFENFKEGKEWYKPSRLAPRPSVIYDYVIITTNAIESASTKLNDFVNYLTNKGFSPLVITEDEYGGLAGQSPNGTAEKIRKWLIDNYSSYGIVYVLLIGNPDPDDPSSGSDSVGDVPMKMCWPRKYHTSLPDYDESPTDYFYADLTGNWDLDGDGYFGEYCDPGPICGNGHGDCGSGGVDFANEVYVGRLPVYSGVSDLDSVLTKTMNYGNASSIAWRKSALLPMSFSDSSTDGAYLSEAMISDYLTPNSFSNYTLYMQGSVCAAANSSFSSNEELVTGVTRTRWSNNDYGMVWWWGHGSATSAALGYSGCGWGTIMASSDASSLDDSHPSHVYQCSCLNGYPENSSNLGTALLYNGAITTTSASRVSWYAVTSWYTGLKYYCDNASIGYYYGQELVDNDKGAAVALYDVKADMGANQYTWWGGGHWMNLFVFNLYGDPATSLADSDDDPYEENDQWSDAFDLSGYEGTWLSSIYGLGVQADEDYYRIYATPGNERVLVDCRFTHADGDIDLKLTNSSGITLAASNDTVDNEYIDYTVTGPGTYYIRVYHGDAGNTYDLWWNAIAPSDTTPPTVTITSPTSSSTYSTSNSSLNIAGSASDNVGVVQVTWSNNRGGSGTCTGTTSWSKTSITLYSGQNIITVTSRDAAGNTGTDTLTVTYTACPDCSGDVVVLENVTFYSGTTCECVGTTSITAGTGVTIQSGATVTFTAPTVKLQPGFHAESGAVVRIKQ